LTLLPLPLRLGLRFGFRRRWGRSLGLDPLARRRRRGLGPFGLGRWIGSGRPLKKVGRWLWSRWGSGHSGMLKRLLFLWFRLKVPSVLVNRLARVVS